MGPIATALSGVASLPLLRFVHNKHESQKCYIYNGSAVERVEDLLLFFKQLTEHGSYFGYSMNAPK